MNQTIAIYEEVSDITENMLAAARRGDWDELATLETQCSIRIGMLREQDVSLSLSEKERLHKISLIQKILDDDRNIRAIVMPWMMQLSALLNRTGTERRLNRAYGLNQSG